MNVDLEKLRNKLCHPDLKITVHFKYIRNALAFSFWAILHFIAVAQQNPDSTFIDIDFNVPRNAEIAGIEILGSQSLDKSTLIVLSNLFVGQKIKIPGEEITRAIEKLWKAQLFESITIKVNRWENGKVYLVFELEEKPRLSYFAIRGLSRSQAKNIRDELHFLKAGVIVNDNILKRTRLEIESYYAKKGFLYTTAAISQEPDPNKTNFTRLKINIEKGKKIRINDVLFAGNIHISAAKLRRGMKETKRVNWNIFKPSKFIESEYENDKQSIIEAYLGKGYRDVRILSDSIFFVTPDRINLVIHVEEGHRYYFRNISFSGNTKYKSSFLDSILSIRKGEIFNQALLDSRLTQNPYGFDVASLYMDDGYLFFNAQPNEISVTNDSIDIDIRINEGPQAIINRIILKGNTKTSDKVILRELRTRPGMKFSRSDITRSIRELAQLGYFDPEQLGVNPIPNVNNGTVDIEYKLEEKPNDQIELSGGYGGIGGIVGVLGLTLNNFSLRKAAYRREWAPIPSGDGQRLQIRAQSNGVWWRSLNFSFTEPWLGGKKPNAFTMSTFHSVQSGEFSSSLGMRPRLKTTGGVISLGKRLKKPDDFFVAQWQLNYQRFDNKYYNLRIGGNTNGGLTLPNGIFNDISFRFILSRSSISDPIFPESGGNFVFSVSATPPYTFLTQQDYMKWDEARKLKWMEYHKWKFDAQWFTSIGAKFVLATRANFGFMGGYRKEIGAPLFNRFLVGGSGLTGFSLDGREVVSLRGFQDVGSLSDGDPTPIYNRFTAEVRYPITKGQQATVYLLTFLEAGNAWMKIRDYNPFGVRRAFGGGVRLFLPMFGLLGIDFGYPFDPLPGQEKKFISHFFLGQQF